MDPLRSLIFSPGNRHDLVAAARADVAGIVARSILDRAEAAQRAAARTAGT